jgi:hypothetical protein
MDLQRSGKSVVVVDDDRDVAELVQAILLIEGFKVSCVYFVGRYGSESAGLNQPHYRFVMHTSRPVGNLRRTAEDQRPWLIAARVQWTIGFASTAHPTRLRSR